MDSKYHFIRDKVTKGSINLIKVHTTLNAADFLTKCLPGPAFQRGLEMAKILADRMRWSTRSLCRLSYLVRKEGTGVSKRKGTDF